MTLPDSENLIKKFASVSRGNLNLNFKNSNKLLNLLKNIKIILSNNKVRDDSLIKDSAKIIDEFYQSKNFQRKLNQLFGVFFENGDNIFRIKKLIWAIFIYLRCKLLSISTNILERYQLLLKVTSLITSKIPTIYFPSSLKVNDNNKSTIVQTILSEKSKTKVDAFDYNPIINELPKNLDFSNPNQVQAQIDHFYLLYQNEYLKNQPMFDERLMLSDFFKSDSSPIKFNSYSNLLKPLPCARQLFTDIKDDHGSSFHFHPKSYSLDARVNHTPIDMTPCTRAVTLENWAKKFINGFNPQTVLDLQNKYIPTLYEYNPELKPINEYIRKLLIKFEQQQFTYTTRILTSFDDITKMCLKLISQLLQKDLLIFTEEFCAMLLYNEDFIKAMVAISMEIILFIEDIEEISFNRIPELLGLDVYDLWKVLNPSQLRSIIFHKEIKDHLEEIEDQLLSLLIWRNPSPKFQKDIDAFFEEDNINVNNKELEQVTEFEYKNQSLFLFHKKEDFALNFENATEPKNVDIYYDLRKCLKSYKYLNGVSILLRRILSYCNSLNKNIFDNLGESNKEGIESETFLKQILTSKSYIKILYGRHIDHLVLSVIITILISHQQFTFNVIETESDFNFEIKKPKITIHKLQEIYMRSKPGQLDQVSKMIFKKVKITDKKFGSMVDYYNQSFKINFQDYINNLNLLNGENNEFPIKKRKLSFYEEESKINSNQEALKSKSAFSSKVDNYQPLQKKINFYENRNGLYEAYFNEFKSKRTQKLKELYSYLIQLESEHCERIKISNSMDKKLKLNLGVGNSGKKFD